MTVNARAVGRVFVTLIFIAGAGAVGWELWNHYMNDPWTRDARVRADVVEVAPDVSGLVSEVRVKDNAPVHKGDVLFRIDRERFAIALEVADATVDGRKATLSQARRDRERYDKLGDVVSQQKAEQARAAEAEADAAYRQSVADRNLARLNLDRSDVRAPVNGIVTNLGLKAGDYITAGHGEIALVDTDSLRVEGYFEETKLPRIKVGDAAAIRLMGRSAVISGHVESIAAGIEDRERSAGSGLLANINPTFSWVRLAQRVPVRIALDKVPDGLPLVAGLTATVEVLR